MRKVEIIVIVLMVLILPIHFGLIWLYQRGFEDGVYQAYTEVYYRSNKNLTPEGTGFNCNNFQCHVLYTSETSSTTTYVIP